MSNGYALRRISLKAAAKEVDRMEKRYINKPDLLDKGIEPKVRPVVIALVAHGFRTQNSCEGHLESNLYPWVRLQPMASRHTKRSLFHHLQRIHFEVEQLSLLLAEFWESGSLTPDREIKASLDWDSTNESDNEVVEQWLEIRAKRFIALPGYWIRCAGAEALSTLPAEVLGPHRKSILKHRQQDMLSFAKFLDSKVNCN